jgi:hypothetical protein
VAARRASLVSYSLSGMRHGASMVARPDQGRDGDLRIFGFVHWFSQDQIRAMSIGLRL